MENVAYSSVQAVGPPDDALDRAVERARDALLRLQKPDGYWAFELEADATIPAEYILLDHYLDTINQPLHERMAVYLRGIQEPEHGGWPLFHRGGFDISATVKAYFALKCVGDSLDAPHMARARQAILDHGGAEKSNVFTRIQLALFGAVPWKAVPVMPVEIVLLPKWFPFHLSKVSYWSRTVIVPLLVLMAEKPRAKNPRNITLDELFVTPPELVKNWHSNTTRSIWNPVFRGIDAVLRAIVEPLIPKFLRRRAIERASAWVAERLNGEDGLGGIYPAMANTAMMFECLGVPRTHEAAATARRAIDKMVVDGHEHAYCQPCLSPVWDTSLAGHALMEAGSPRDKIEQACDWLANMQILDVKGDWTDQRPDLRPGGWAFQYANPYYPDVDDTAVVAMLLHRLDPARYNNAIGRAEEWIRGMQSKNGGWGAFDVDNEYYYLNHIPFADHGALLDPPTADVSARCIGMLGQLRGPATQPGGIFGRALAYLLKEQEEEGCWFGRWGTNYIYGTWSALCALNAAGIDHDAPAVRRAARWLISKQRHDGGWGEDGASYWKDWTKGEGKASTPAQTAWALLGLMAAGEINHPAVAQGIDYLLRTQNADGLWDEFYYTAVGFPRVFYLRYHGYKAFFPLWALARYRNLKRSGASRVEFGM
jgi:squalene-hopene/tetraprenyl-beta-curcumene cyclase